MAHHLLAQALHDKVVAVAPTIRGVSMGSFSDKSTWVVHFKSGTHQTTKDAAAAEITAFDIDAESAILEAITPSII